MEVEMDHWPEMSGPKTAPLVDPEKFGPHHYPDYGSSSSCVYGCGCWMGESRSSGPVNPHGACPKNPRPAPAAVPAPPEQPGAPRPTRAEIIAYFESDVNGEGLQREFLDSVADSLLDRMAELAGDDFSAWLAVTRQTTANLERIADDASPLPWRSGESDASLWDAFNRHIGDLNRREDAVFVEACVARAYEPAPDPTGDKE